MLLELDSPFEAGGWDCEDDILMFCRILEWESEVTDVGRIGDDCFRLKFCGPMACGPRDSIYCSNSCLGISDAGWEHL